MSAPEPRANPLLLGHEAAESLLAEAQRSGRMHHAWLITGPEGVGKATTSAVVLSMASVLIVDYFVTALLSALGIT